MAVGRRKTHPKVSQEGFLVDSLFKKMHKHIKTKENRSDKVVRTVLKKIFENIGNALLESDDGVYMKGMGYFYIFMSPNPNMKRKNICASRTDLTHVSGRRHYISFDPIGEKNGFMGFTLDHMEDSKLRERLHNKLKGGKRYKSRLSTFKKVKKISI